MDSAIYLLNNRGQKLKGGWATPHEFLIRPSPQTVRLREECKIKYGAVADRFVPCWGHRCIISWRSLFREDIAKLILCIVKLHLSCNGSKFKIPGRWTQNVFSAFRCHAPVHHRRKFMVWFIKQFSNISWWKLLKQLKAGFEYFISICCIFHSSSSFMEN